MAKEGQEITSRKMKRHSDSKRKMNRILNILIAIVFALIVINLYFIVKDDGKKETAKEEETVEETKDTESEKEARTPKEDNEPSKLEENKEQDNVQKDHSSIEDKNNAEIIVSTSTDANVEKVIVNNNWQVTPTRQTGEHISAFEEGHVDYEEKLVTIRNAVELPEDDIIYWSVRNDGTGKGAISVVSSKDQSKKYRVHIKWIDNSGWIPIKVEVLKEIPKN
ncbi:YrrS family protein [Ureibacillus thermophilus]|uniref:YrrS family protein n=1 Tax=Ureibacillus thermophilus TaxID=367743 RepID=UPI003606C3A5